MKKRLLIASGVYFGMWGLFGLSYLFWNTTASTSTITSYSNQMFHSALSYFGLAHFKWINSNVSAFLLALIITYLMWLGVWFGVDRFLTNREV